MRLALYQHTGRAPSPLWPALRRHQPPLMAPLFLFFAVMQAQPTMTGSYRKYRVAASSTLA